MPTVKLFNRNFVLLFQGQFVSNICQSIYLVGLTLWLKETTNSATVVGLILMTSFLPSVILGPLGGTVADMFSRKTIIILSDVINGCLILTVALIMLLLPDVSTLHITLLFFTALGSGTVNAFFRPAINAAVPDLVSPNRIESANGILQSSLQVAFLAGQALGGVLFKTVGLPIIMLAEGVGFLLSAFSESFIELNKTIREKISSKEITGRLKTDTIEGFKYVRRTAGLQELFIIFALLNFFFAPLPVLLPFFVENSLHATADWYGYLFACMSLGLLTGSAMASLLNLAPHTRSRLIITLLLIFSACIGGLGYSPNTSVALSVLFVLGTSFGVIYPFVISAIQLNTPNNILGRVLGLLNTVSLALTPIAMGFAGVIADFLDQNITVIFASSGFFLFIASFFLFFSAEFHAFFNYKINAVK